MTVGSTTGFPASFPYYLAVDFGTSNLEVVEVTAATGLVLTIVRGVSGTVALQHSSGAAIVHVAPAQFYNDTSVHTNSSSGVHGITGAVVGTTDAQTLTNKTIDLIANTFTGTLPIVSGGTASTTASAARTALGVAIGTNVEAWSAGLDASSTVLAAGGGTQGLLAVTGANTVAARTLTAGSSKVSITNPAGVAGNPTVDVSPANIMAGLHSPITVVLAGAGGVGGSGGSGATATYNPSPMPAYLRIYGCNGGYGGGGSTGGGSGGSVAGGGAGGAGAYKIISTTGLTFPLQVNAGGGAGAGGAGGNGGTGGQSTVIDNNGAGATLWTPGVPSANGVGRGDVNHAGAVVGNNSGFDPSTTGPVADVVLIGSPGSDGIMVSATQGYGGGGGRSFFGGGGATTGFLGNTAGNAPGYGGGGGGASSTTTNKTGGGAGGGIVIIEPIY